MSPSPEFDLFYFWNISNLFDIKMLSNRFVWLINFIKIKIIWWKAISFGGFTCSIISVKLVSISKKCKYFFDININRNFLVYFRFFCLHFSVYFFPHYILCVNWTIQWIWCFLLMSPFNLWNLLLLNLIANCCCLLLLVQGCQTNAFALSL